MQYFTLRYKGWVWPRTTHRIDENGDVSRWLKTRKIWKPMRLYDLASHDKPGERYRYYMLKNPLTGKHMKVVASRAFAESKANGNFDPGMDACHPLGSKRSDIVGCVLKRRKDNRKDRVQAGTYSTGHETWPGKLAGDEQEILRRFDSGQSEKSIAEHFRVTRQAIRHQLKKHGRK